MFQHVQQGALDEFAKSHIVTLLDSFKHKGPNGTHRCLVFEPLGPSVDEALESIYPSASSYCRVKVLLKQVLLGLHCLHESGIVHGDLNPRNILFATKPFTEQHAVELCQEPAQDKISPEVKRKDGKVDKWSPKRLYLSQPLAELEYLEAGTCCKLSDLGAADLLQQHFSSTDRPRRPTQQWRSELLKSFLGRPLDQRIDIWSFGCLVFELLTGNVLFPVSNLPAMQQQCQTDDDHLLQMHDTLGRLPHFLCNKWPRCHRYFGPDMDLIRSDVGPAETPKGEIYIGPSLDELIKTRRPEQMDEQEVHQVTSLLRRMLQYDRNLRPSTAELLADDWFRSIDSSIATVVE